jgi:amino acid transporter
MLSYKFRLPGFILIAAGIIMTILFFTIDFRIEIPVLAIVSSYMETKFFAIFKTNFADELIILTLLAGLSLVAFSEEKDENEMHPLLRSRAFAKTALINTVFMAISVIFIYGTGFMSVMIADIFLPFVIYLVVFNSPKRRLKKAE